MAVTFEHFDERVAKGLTTTEQPSVAGWLGAKITEVEAGRLVATVDVRPDMLTMIGNLHGGVIAALVDHVLGTIFYPVMPRGYWAATTEFKLNYLSPVREGSLRAEARIVSMTRRTGVVQIEVTNGDRVACIAQGTCLIVEPRSS